MNDSGMEVETKSGKLGRTYVKKGLINGKVPVYIATEIEEKNGFKFGKKYSEKAILCEPSSLKIIGYIN